MIAHSFTGEIFGPAQRMHGATYIVDLEMRRKVLDDDGLVVDIGLASQSLNKVLAELNFQNLDEVAEFKGKNTTTEFMAEVIFTRMIDQIKVGNLGNSAGGLDSLRVTLHESHIAWASFEGDVDV
jgi:6-pyruvoyl-tetrahydropterin synthase